MTTKEDTRTATVATPSDLEVRIDRVFDAPRDRVYAVFNDPTLISEWWGSGTTVEEMDVREGGTWRFVTKNDQGWEMVTHGTYREVTPPERIVRTFESDALPGGGLVETIVFEDLGEQTRITTISLFEAKEHRDQLLPYMGPGAEEGYKRFEAVLAKHA
jgi:uncharacterized protein YndB with AHSA1/START domain